MIIQKIKKFNAFELKGKARDKADYYIADLNDEVYDMEMMSAIRKRRYDVMSNIHEKYKSDMWLHYMKHIKFDKYGTPVTKI